jgi:hypothetical protein
MTTEKKSLVDNAADTQQVKKAEDVERNIRKNELTDLATLLDQPAGRRFVVRLLDKMCGVWSTSYSESASRMAWLEGHRNIGLGILADIDELGTEVYFKLLKERELGNGG